MTLPVLTMTPEVREKIRSANGVSQLIDAKKRTWTSPSTGHVFKLKPVSVGLLGRISSDRTLRPEVPRIVVNYGGEQGLEYNPDDPTYKRAYEEWQGEIKIRILMYTFSAGIDISVPDDFRVDVLPWHSDPTDTELRYYYVTAIIPSDEWDVLSKAILGQNAPTEDGIADASAGFPSAGEGR